MGEMWGPATVSAGLFAKYYDTTVLIGHWPKAKWRCDRVVHWPETRIPRKKIISLSFGVNAKPRADRV